MEQTAFLLHAQADVGLLDSTGSSPLQLCLQKLAAKSLNGKVRPTHENPYSTAAVMLLLCGAKNLLQLRVDEGKKSGRNFEESFSAHGLYPRFLTGQQQEALCALAVPIRQLEALTRSEYETLTGGWDLMMRDALPPLFPNDCRELVIGYWRPPLLDTVQQLILPIAIEIDSDSGPVDPGDGFLASFF